MPLRPAEFAVEDPSANPGSPTKDNFDSKIFGKMHPVQIAHMLIRASRWHQTTVAVALKQILDDGAGFGQHQISVLNDR